MAADPAGAVMAEFPGVGLESLMNPGAALMALGAEAPLMAGMPFGDASFLGAEAPSELASAGTSCGYLPGGQFSRAASSEAPARGARCGAAPLAVVSGAEASPSGGVAVGGRAEGDTVEGRGHVASALPVSGREVVLRAAGTFMESMQLREDMTEGSLRRSWSDSDLPAFREAMEDTLMMG
uniref:Uncharacterized protein n=1 Tax=Pyrodinium bahamense TaxID=73915 RepID=A0A7S0AHS7_9DINO